MRASRSSQYFPDYPEPIRQAFARGKAIEAGILTSPCTTAALDTRRPSIRRRRPLVGPDGHEGAGMGRRPDDMHRGNASVVPTPAGRLFDQETAQRWSGESHLCSAARYEGIDQRRRRRCTADAGGRGFHRRLRTFTRPESAALVMIEVVVRLLPDVMGNLASHQDDSYSDLNGRLLEGLSYTRPPDWRGPGSA